MKMKIWYKDGEFPEEGEGYEEFKVRAKHKYHDRILLFKNHSSTTEIIVDEVISDTSSKIRSIEADKILQWRLVEEEKDE